MDGAITPFHSSCCNRISDLLTEKRPTSLGHISEQVVGRPTTKIFESSTRHSPFHMLSTLTIIGRLCNNAHIKVSSISYGILTSFSRHFHVSVLGFHPCLVCIHIRKQLIFIELLHARSQRKDIELKKAGGANDEDIQNSRRL